MQVVGARLCHDIDRRAARSAQVRGIIAAVYLELLHRILAHRETHASGIRSGFAAIYRHIVSSAIAAVERQAALRRLLDAKILVVRDAG